MFYRNTISEAINVTDTAVLQEVENIMRDIIFHSTLDWQTMEQLQQGAKEAYEVYGCMQTWAPMTA